MIKCLCSFVCSVTFVHVLIDHLIVQLEAKNYNRFTPPHPPHPPHHIPHTNFCTSSRHSMTLKFGVQHSPETEGNVRSTLVLYKKIPEYSQLADETYLNLKPIYM